MTNPGPVDATRVAYPDLPLSGRASRGGDEYGSDFSDEEAELLSSLLSNLATTRPDDGDEDPTGGLPATAPPRGHAHHSGRLQPYRAGRVQAHGDVGVPTVHLDESQDGRTPRAVDESTETGNVLDTRSPLLRFRTAPKKPLSVTDLVSPSWCEVQYWYTLTKHGRKRRTAAMRQGSVIHKALEDEVHTTVPVEIASKEEAWGLRLWNVIQGLRTLSETGLTRELEVWGEIDGLLVNGVIDQVSHSCPDPAVAAEIDGSLSAEAPPVDQTTLDDFFHRSEGRDARASRLVYITDVKTRSSKVMPKDASFRPTLLQLMLYHRLLSDLAANRLSGSTLFSRYDLDPSVSFSDSFVAQLTNLDENDVLPTSDTTAQPAARSLLSAHNSLAALWELVTKTFASAFPQGAKSVSPVLYAEYRRPVDGAVVGSKTCLYDHAGLQAYLNDEIRWWKGERKAVGVPVEEAFKCRSCDFAESCAWRIQKVDEATARHRFQVRSAV
ncbi:MAG: hypothetical protein M1838_000928 [Thelocarpon superellum]|nr:MAG: hypothetical protein M1838_000928 [Thelocarpon superellum]